MKKLLVLVFALIAVIGMVFAVSAADAEKLTGLADVSKFYKADGSEVVGGGMNGGSYISHLFDGGYGACYNNNVGSYIITDLNAKLPGGYYVTEVKIYHSNNSTFSLYYTKDGVTWTPIVENAKVTEATYAVGDTATQIKYVFTTCANWTASAKEIEIYGIDPAELTCTHSNIKADGWTPVPGSATCTGVGKVSQTCPDCQEVLEQVSNDVLPLGHDIVTTVTTPGTSISYGAATLKCSRCAYTIDFSGEVNMTSSDYCSIGESQQFTNVIVSSIADLWGASKVENMFTGDWENVGPFHTWVAAGEVDEEEYVMLNFQGEIDLTKVKVMVQNDSGSRLVISALNSETGEYEVVKDIVSYDSALGGGAALVMEVPMLGVTTSSIKIQSFSNWRNTNGYYYNRMVIGELEVLGIAKGCGLDADNHECSFDELVDYIVVPTCQTAGSATYKCACNNTTTLDVEASPEFHNYVEVEGTRVAATCTTAGSYTGKCEYCEEETTVEIAVDAEGGHAFEETGRTEADCVNAGSIEYKCANCEATKSEEIVALGHKYGEAVVVPSDCKNNGSSTVTCTVCGNEEVTELETTGCTWTLDSIVTEPTCGAAGEANYVCSVCGETKVDAVAATGEHVWDTENVNITLAPSCTGTGAGDYTCTVCGKVEKLAVAALGHNWVDATCTTAKYCTRCNTVVGEALGHSYFYECDKVCQVCGEESNPEATHTLVHVDAVAATCTTNGNVEYWNCSICGYAWLDEACTLVTNQMSVVVPAAHSYQYACDKACQVCGEESNPDATHTIVYVEAVEATCTENGNVEYWYCSICGYAWLDEACTLVTNQMSVVVPAGHVWMEGNTWPYPSCVSDGIVYYYCENCDETKQETIPADLENIDHHDCALEWETRVPATCQTSGYEKYTCNNCGKVFEIVTPASEDLHEWVTDEALSTDATCLEDGLSVQNCSVCGETRELVLEKEFYGSHIYGYDPETYVAATCQQDGYAFYTCEVCGDSYEETTSAGPWLHEWVNSSNGLIQTCSVCDEVSFGNAELSGVENGFTAMFAWEGTALNIWNNEFDVYYSFEVISSENGVYVLVLNADDDSFGFNGATAVLTTVSDGGTLVVTTADETATYTFENKAPDYNYLLNGTYAYYDAISGDLMAAFKFEDGIITVLVDNMGMNFPETFSYKYDPVSGVISTPEVMFANFSVYDGVIYFGRGFELVPYEAEPEEPVNYGDKIGSIEVETTDTFGFFDFYSYTADKAGQYSFFVPAGLGFYTKAKYDILADAEVGFYDNTNGEFVVMNLAAGETVEFYVGATTKGDWDIDVYYYTEHTHTEVEIPAILPTPSTEGFTAGIMCSDCGETLVAPVAINVTEMANTKDPNFRVASASLDLAESICVFYKAVVTEGYNNAYMVFVFGGEEFVVTEYTIEAGTGRYVYRFTGAPAYKMAENIEAYVYAETATGEYSVNKVLEYSVMTYCVNQLKKNASDAMYVRVISDVLTLGAANQVFEGYNTNALVTDLVKAQGYTLTPTAFDSINAPTNAQALTGDRTQGVDWKSAGMLLGSNIKVQLKFETDFVNDVTVKINVAGEDRYFTAEDFTMDGNRYVVTIDYLTSKQYDDVITGTFYVDGEQIGSTLTYSVNSYIARNLTATGSKLTLLKAIYVYGETMKEFFAD